MGNISDNIGTIAQTLAARGYWVARVWSAFKNGKYSRAVGLCRENQHSGSQLLSGHLICARSLYHTDQLEAAEKELQPVLSRDPDNLVALKYLGDIRHQQGDVIGSVAHYERILQIDPQCRGLVCQVKDRPGPRTRTVSLRRKPEAAVGSGRLSTRRIPFMTETIGDLYLAQGYPRLAAEVFHSLNKENQSPRLADKLDRAEQVIKDKEK